MSGDPRQCRQHALECARLARTLPSAEARDAFSNLAKSWLRLAVDLKRSEVFLEELHVSGAVASDNPARARPKPTGLRRPEQLMTPRLDQSAAETIAEKLTGGYWTHDYALTAAEARSLGLPVKVGMPLEVMAFMKLDRNRFDNPVLNTFPSMLHVSDEFEPKRAERT